MSCLNLLTAKQAATQMGVAVTTLATWRSRGNGPVYLKRGGKVFYRASDIEAFVAARTTEHGGAQ
ncbi:Helix-turn-helix domain-containing protein [Andreprevotia lacus DSM 23236]|jgi:predicted site-specific integrase-resolvase|uniref:Helix-turn-helix domain-containing protein n=1 Tax=Andreprevotia lacus DSM 23236 TaxID=1121001 RepID=A0A1W1X2D4_9NEIS|nr:helix-turn-helix domain-containing protein [Andreprevotia lacus]SMC17983.1 Helix-turn-helix domain-containing protein [Andreprevotia lacus DSM 23236]